MPKQAQTLAKTSPAQLKRFLVELANLQDDLDALRRLQERFAAFIPPFDQSWLVLEEKEGVFAGKTLDQYKGDFLWILMLRIMLRNLWTEPDLRQKEWGAFALRYVLYTYGNDAFSDDNLLRILENPARAVHIPPPSPFEHALNYLVKSDRARYCANPECPAPYFFAERKNQRYCSEICAAPAQRELKRRWWAEHGEEWRAARQSKKPSKGRAGKGKSGIRQKQTNKKAQKGSK